jgi:hypothetical protein
MWVREIEKGREWHEQMELCFQTQEPEIDATKSVGLRVILWPELKCTVRNHMRRDC